MRAHLVIDSRLKSDNKFCGPPAAPQMLSHLIEQGLESILRERQTKNPSRRLRVCRLVHPESQSLPQLGISNTLEPCVY